MWTDHTRITYTGTALPTGVTTVVMFNSTTAFGPRSATHYRCFFFDISILPSQTGTVELQVSDNGGTSFHIVNTAISVTAAAVGTPVCFYVAPYADWQIVWTNGGVDQASFAVNMIIDHNSRGSLTGVSKSISG